MSSEDKAASESTESQLPEERAEGSTQVDWEARARASEAQVTKLQQQAAKAERLNGEAMPWVQLALALNNAPGGKTIIEKLQKGVPLTEAQQTKLEAAQVAAGSSSLSLEAVEKLFEEKVMPKAIASLEQRLYETDRAKRDMEKLNTKATKELVGFEALQNTPEWNQALDLVLFGIEHRKIAVPDEEDPYWFAFKKAHAMILGENPEIGKVKPAKKTETERKGAISRQASQSTEAHPEEQSGVPDYANPGIAPLGMGGRSFGSLRRS